MQTNGQDDINQEENSCAMHEKEAIDLQQKEDLVGSKRASETNQVSSATIQGANDLQKRQRSNATNGDVELCKEKTAVSPETDKDFDILKPEEKSSPRIPSQESHTQDTNPPKVSLLMKDEPSLENPQPRRNLDSVAHSLQSKQESNSSGVPGDASKAPKDMPVTLNLKQSPDRRAQTSEMDDSEIKGKEEIMSDIVLPLQTLGSASAPQSDNTKLTGSARHEKAVKKLHPRRNPVTGGQSSQGNQQKVASRKNKCITTIPEGLKPKSFQPTQILYPGNQTIEKKEENCTSMRKEKDSGNSIHASTLCVGVSASQSGQENLTYTKKVEKVEKLQPRRNPDPVVQGSRSDESTPKVSEKGMDEGYNWRKYGQKLVKGNDSIRSYYRCTYPGCQAKKQVEKLHDGCKPDVNYFGKHEHAKPQHAQVMSAFKDRIPELPVAPASKNHTPSLPGQGGSDQQVAPTESPCLAIIARNNDAVAGLVSCSSNDDAKDGHPDSKRQKTETTSVDDKPSSDLRHVVRTLSEVDIVNDGYRWRKYGQKLVKGNPNPRSYYRCSNAGCPVKKHVERASHDPKIVITTYEGHHDHDIPLSRIADQSMPIADANTTTTNGDSRSESQENNSVRHEIIAHVSAN